MFVTPRASEVKVCVTASYRSTFTAYTPWGGRSSGGAPRFAVGKPIVRPRSLPCVTTPVSGVRAPEDATHLVEIPGATARRARVLE